MLYNVEDYLRNKSWKPECVNMGWRILVFYPEPMEKSVIFTGACANEIIPSINRSFVYKTKEGGHVRMLFSLPDPECHVRYCHHLVSVVVLKLLYFTLLLLNDWARSEIHERNKGPKVSKRYCLFLIFFSEYMSTHGLLF